MAAPAQQRPVFTPAQQQQLTDLYNKNELSRECIEFMSELGLPRCKDVWNVLKSHQQQPVEFFQRFMNEAPPTVVYLVIKGLDDNSAIFRALKEILPIMPTTERGATVDVRTMEIDVEPAEELQLSVMASALQAVETSTLVGMKTYKKNFEMEKDALKFESGRTLLRMMIDALKDGQKLAILKKMIEALFASRCAAIAYTPFVRSTEEYNRFILGGLPLTGFLQRSGTSTQMTLDRLVLALRSNAKGVRMSLTGSESMDTNPIYVILPPGALNHIVFNGSNDVVSQGGLAAEIVRDEGGKSFYFGGYNFVEFSRQAGLSLHDMEFATKSMRSEFAISPESTSCNMDDECANRNANMIIYRSLDNKEARIECIHLSDAFLRCRHFMPPSGMDASYMPRRWFSSNFGDLNKQAGDYNMSVPTMNGEFAPDVLITPTTNDPRTRQPRTVAVPALGGVWEYYTNDFFLTNALRGAQRIVSNAITKGSSAVADQPFALIGRMFDDMLAARTPNKLAAASNARLFVQALADSGNDATAFGIKGLPDITTVQNPPARTPNSPFYGMSTMAHAFYFASLYPSAARNQFEQEWATAIGEEAFTRKMKIYHDGVRALVKHFLPQLQEIFGNFEEDLVGSLSVNGRPQGSGLNSDTATAQLINVLEALVAPEIGTAVRAFVRIPLPANPYSGAEVMEAVSKMIDGTNQLRVSIRDSIRSAFVPGSKAETSRQYMSVWKTYEFKRNKKDIRTEIMEKINAKNFVNREEKAVMVSTAISMFTSHHCTDVDSCLEVIEDSVIQQQLPINDPVDREFKKTDLFFSPRAFLVENDPTATAALTVRPQAPGSPDQAMEITNSQNGYNRVYHYGKNYLAQLLPTKADSSLGMTAEEINATYDWTSQGFLTGFGYRDMRKSITFNRRMLAHFRQGSSGAVLGGINGSTFRRMFDALYLTTKPTGVTLSRMAAAGIRTPFRVVVAWPRICVSQMAAVIAHAGIGVTPVAPLEINKSETKSNHKVAYEAMMPFGSAVLFPKGCMIVSDAMIECVSGFCSTEPFVEQSSINGQRKKFRGSAVYLLQGQTTKTPDVISLAGQGIRYDVDASGKHGPTFDAALFAAVSLPFSQDTKTAVEHRLNNTTVPYKELCQMNSSFQHCAGDVRRAPQYTIKPNGDYRLVARGCSSLSAIGPGTKLDYVNRLQPVE